MIEVKYSLNGHYLHDFGVYISDSKGIADSLERKDIQSYEWAEYHGSSVDLSKPKFKAREIELQCFIEGDDWQQLFENFKDFIVYHFSKPETQRLMIEPFGFDPLVYQVYMQDGIVLEKTFRKGKMVGVFTLNLIEPNPIKKVLKTSLDTFRLRYDSPTETEIFLGDGTKKIGRGNVNFIANYSVPNYQGSGISLVQTSTVNSTYYELYIIPDEINEYMFSCNVKLTAPEDITLYVIGRKPDNTYSVITQSQMLNGTEGGNEIFAVAEINIAQYSKFFYKVLDTSGQEVPGLEFSEPRVESAEIIGEWQNMIGKEKIIIIAGNIDDITNLETPAEIIWNKI